MNSKRNRAMKLALRLYFAAALFDKEEGKSVGIHYLTFWTPKGPKYFHSGAEVREFANKIAKQYSNANL